MYKRQECTENYAAELKRNGVNVDIDVDEMGAKDDPTATAPETEEISGKITEMCIRDSISDAQGA